MGNRTKICKVKIDLRYDRNYQTRCRMSLSLLTKIHQNCSKISICSTFFLIKFQFEQKLKTTVESENHTQMRYIIKILNKKITKIKILNKKMMNQELE